MPTFADRLKQLRLAAGLTQVELGTRLSMSNTTISVYESGKRLPDIHFLIRLADYFRVSLDWLVGREVQ